MTFSYERGFRGACFVLAVLSVTAQHAHAFTPNNVLPTSAVLNIGLQHDIFPRPTTPPRGFELRIRQEAEATCGYIEGASASPVTCGSGLNCATTSTFVGCCDLSDCRGIFTSCYDQLGSPCDQSCQAETQNLICPTSLPYCAEYRYEGGSIGLGCAAVQGYTQTILLSASTGDGGSGPLTTSTTSASTSTSPTPSESSPASPSPAKSGLSTGATAGIAVGVALGVVAVAIVAFIFYRRRKKAKKAEKSAVAGTTTETSQVPPPEPGPDRASKALSELQAMPKSPTSPTSAFYAPQPSPGPPHYSQHYDGQAVEMPDNARPMSYTNTSELGSSRM